jgi:hypothetical protein
MARNLDRTEKQHQQGDTDDVRPEEETSMAAAEP